jgi:hypothetical protein
MAKPELVCAHCGYVGQSIVQMPGSTLVGIFLLLLMILPWLIYSIWRQAAKKEICPSCKKDGTMLSVDSPRGKKLVAEYASDRA